MLRSADVGALNQPEGTPDAAEVPDKVGGGKLLVRLAFGLAVFTSAFLLLQGQLLLGKFLLPWFGGTLGVWATFVLFFLVLLLWAYFYVDQISVSRRPSSHGKIHLAFL